MRKALLLWIAVMGSFYAGLGCLVYSEYCKPDDSNRIALRDLLNQERENRYLWQKISETPRRTVADNVTGSIIFNSNVSPKTIEAVHDIFKRPDYVPVFQKDPKDGTLIWLGCTVVGHQVIWISDWQGFCQECGLRVKR